MTPVPCPEVAQDENLEVIQVSGIRRVLNARHKP